MANATGSSGADRQTVRGPDGLRDPDILTITSANRHPGHHNIILRQVWLKEVLKKKCSKVDPKMR